MIDAEIYGMIPSAKIEALLNDPPRNVFNRPRIPSVLPEPDKLGCVASTPGITIYDPNLKMIKYPIVFRILTRRSSMEKMFLMV
jgi:hypothetical protein